METEPPEYKVEIIQSDVPQIQITPVTKDNTEPPDSKYFDNIVDLERASILSPILLKFLRSPLYKDWLVPDDDPNLARCKFCGDNSYKLDEKILQYHMKTKRHMTNIDSKELKPTCRTCLLQIPLKDVTPLFMVEPTKGCTYEDIVYSVTGIQAVKNDKFSVYLCQPCRRRALQAYNFQLRAQRADAFLKEYGNNVKTEFDWNNVAKANTQKKEAHKLSQNLFTKKESEDIVYEVLSDDSMGDTNYTSLEQPVSDCENSVKEVSTPSNKSKSSMPAASAERNSNTQFASRKCLTCNSTFATVAVLIRHMKFCNRSSTKKDTASSAAKPAIRRANECQICHKSFHNALVLLNHIKTTHRKTLASKPKTNTQISNKVIELIRKSDGKRTTELAKTNRERAPNKPVAKVTKKEPVPEAPTFRCSVCSALFPTEKELETHGREHGNTEVIMCGVCERVYYKYPQFKRHFSVHHPEMEAVVKAKTTETILEVQDPEVMQQILQHVRMTSIGDLITANIPPSEEPVEIDAYVQVCGLCGCVILSPDALQLHNQNEHPDYDMRCIYCAMLFPNEKLLKGHVSRCMKLEKKVECLLCGQKMLVEQQLTVHMSLRHRETKGPKFSCSICSKPFRIESQLNSHRALCEPICECQCDYCHKVFNKKFFLERHVKNFHKRDEQIMSFLCSYCGKGFTRNGQLKRHIYTHTGERPFKCTVEGCDQAFNTSDSCLYHIRKHKGVGSLKCPHCDRCFFKPYVYTKHMMIHTGERPYKCIHCDAGFIQRGCLVQHMKKHSGIEPSLVLDPNPFKKRSRRTKNLLMDTDSSD